MDYANSSPALGLTATTHHTDMIVLTWQPPMDSGGAEIQWYCLEVASTVAALRDLTVSNNDGECLLATAATR